MPKDSEQDIGSKLVEGLQWYLPFIFKGLVVWVIEIVRFLTYPLWPKKDLNGKLLLLTGAGGGIGRESAIKFSEKGVRLILWDIDGERNEETAKILRASNGDVVAAMTVDVSDPEDVKRAGREVREKYGIPDLIFNNAGINGGFNVFECDLEKYERTMKVNARATVLVNNEFLNQMVERNSGHFISLDSVAGQMGCAGLVGYSMSKFALRGYMEALRGEFAIRGLDLKCTTVCPYYVATEMARGAEFDEVVLPMIGPDYLAARIVQAVEYDQELLLLPRWTWFAVGFRGIMPTRVSDIFEEAFNIHTRASPLVKFLKADGLKK